LLAGDPRSAERELRRDYAVLEAVGERYALSTIAGLLGYALLRRGRIDDALDAADAAATMASTDDVESQSLWRRVRATALAATGNAAEALPIAQEAYEIVAATDAPLMKAYALLDLGEVLAAAGRKDDAIGRWRQALSLLERKGALTPAKRVREILDANRPPRG
jgi:tetratricopeptide (TPR) repeat protein